MSVAELLSGLFKEAEGERATARADFLALVDRLAQDKPHRDDGARARAILLAAGMTPEDLSQAVERRRKNRALALVAREMDQRKATHKASCVESAAFDRRRADVLLALEAEAAEIKKRHGEAETRLREAGEAFRSLLSLAPEAVLQEFDSASRALDVAQRAHEQALRLGTVRELRQAVSEAEAALAAVAHDRDSMSYRAATETLRARREALALAERRDSGELAREVGRALARLAAVRAEILGQ